MLSAEEVQAIESPQALSAAILKLRASFLTEQGKWQSWTVDAYLGAMSAWLEDAEQSGMLDKTSPDALRMVASVLAAGSVYE